MLEGVITAFGTLCMVAVIIYLSYVFSKKIAKGSMGRSRSSHMKIYDQLAVGQDRSVAVVQVGDRFFLVGITSNQINLLMELDEEGLIPLQHDEVVSTSMSDFKEILSKFGSKINRK